MTQDENDKLVSLGINIEETLERFVENEKLLFKCLKTFCADENYSSMISAIDSGDATAAFDAAHALKGVSANLGLTFLYEQVKIITDVFRAGRLDYDPGNLEKVKYEYNRAISVINTL